jgi:hypothetical protein
VRKSLPGARSPISKKNCAQFDPDPLANGWQNFTWKTGTFDTGQRGLTERVEGKILLPHALVIDLSR